MTKILACRVLEKEIKYVSPQCEPEFFEPLCHALRGVQFREYVESLVDDHEILVCGDCGGLSDVARRRGLRISTQDDCIRMLAPGSTREPKCLYLTDGWLRHFDTIFGLDRLAHPSRMEVARAMLAPVGKIEYIHTEASRDREEGARKLAEALGCEFHSSKGSLREIVELLEGTSARPRSP